MDARRIFCNTRQVQTPVYRQPICCGVSVAKRRHASRFASMSPCKRGRNAWYFAVVLLTLLVRPVEQRI